MRILLIGLGKWGRNHLKALKAITKDVVVADVNVPLLMDLDVPCSADYRMLLRRVDAVIIATPADTHFEICKECLEKGKDVFVEKPLALTSKEAKELIDLSGRLGRVLQVGHIYRYHPATQKIKGLIEEGVLGEIRYAYGHFMRFKRPRTDVGVTQTDAIHYFDLFNYLFYGPPQAVTSVIGYHLGLPLDDTSVSVLDYQGKTVLVEAGYLPPEDKRDIAIIGSKASIYYDFRWESLQLTCNCHEGHIAKEGGTHDFFLPSGEPLTTELVDFMACILDRFKPLSDGKAGYEALRVVEACHRSAASGEKVRL